MIIGSWWDPGSWWHSIAGDVSAAENEVKRLIRSGVDWAIKQVESVVDMGFGFVAAVIHNITNDIANAWSWIHNTWSSVINILDHAIPDGLHWVEGEAVGWYHDALHYADDVFGWARNAFDIARHDLAAYGDWVLHEIVDPVFSWIEHAADFVGHLIAAAADRFYHDVILPIWHALDNAYHWAETLWDWYLRIARDVVDVCVKAFDWLVWFALHPAAGFEEIVHDSLNEFSLSHIIELSNTADDWVDGILDDFAKVIA